MWLRNTTQIMNLSLQRLSLNAANIRVPLQGPGSLPKCFKARLSVLNIFISFTFKSMTEAAHWHNHFPFININRSVYGTKIIGYDGYISVESLGKFRRNILIFSFNIYIALSKYGTYKVNTVTYVRWDWLSVTAKHSPNSEACT